MPVSPWSDASKALVNAIFGDPEKQAEFDKLGIMREQLGLEKQKFDLDAAFNPYKIEQAKAAARATGAEALLKELQGGAQQDFLNPGTMDSAPMPSSPSQDVSGIPQMNASLLESNYAARGSNPVPGRPMDFAGMLEDAPPAPRDIGDIVGELTAENNMPVAHSPAASSQGGMSALMTPEIRTMIAAGYLKPENIADLLLANESADQNQRIADPGRRMATFSAGAKAPYSTDETLAQALLSERDPSEIATLAEGKVRGRVPPNIPDLLNPPGEITMGPPAPGERLVPERSMADRLFEAGVQSSNPELMRMGNLAGQREIQNDFRRQQMDNQQVQNYSKATDEISAFVPAITNFNETLKKYPPGTDIPGVGGLDTLLPSIALSPEGRQNRQDFMAVGNGIVYLLSGKQINEAEGRRLAAQMGGTIENGTFELKNQFTDDQMRRGVENVTKQIQSKLKNTGAMLSPSALQEYQARGGTVLPGQLDQIVNGLDQGDAGIPQEAVQDLMADPSPEAQAEFDDAFGPGASQRVLGGQ
jgi:hypothetical protein